jgi:hypothetical protein
MWKLTLGYSTKVMLPFHENKLFFYGPVFSNSGLWTSSMFGSLGQFQVPRLSVLNVGKKEKKTRLGIQTGSRT